MIIGEDRAGRAALLRVAAVVVGVGVLVSPVVRDHDSFPLSTYPVYSSARPDTATFVTAHGLRADGSPRPLSMDVIARTDDPLIAASRMNRAAQEGRSADVCAQIAGRAPDDVVAVVVVRERHDVVAAARGDRSVRSSDELARCEVQP